MKKSSFSGLTSSEKLYSLCSSWMPRWYLWSTSPVNVEAEVHVGVCGPTATGNKADIHDPGGLIAMSGLLLSTEAIVISRPMLPPKALSGSMALLQLGFVLMSVACVTAEGHECPLSGLPTESILMSVSHTASRDHIDVRTEIISYNLFKSCKLMPGPDTFSTKKMTK